MSPLQPVFSQYGLPRAAAMIQRGLGGCLLLAALSCSFDKEPRTGKRGDSTSDPSWMPPSAAHDAERSRDAGADAADGAAVSDASTTDTGSAASSSNAPADAGQRPSKRQDAGAAMFRDPPAPDAGEHPDHTDHPAMPGPQDAATSPEPSRPDAGSGHVRCKPGVYTGTFSGSIQVIGLSLSTVTGTVRAKLERDASGEHLVIRDGRVSGVDQDGNMLACGLSGTIGCEDQQLVDGRLEDGNFHNVGSDSDTAFAGAVQAMYSDEPHSLVGTWTVEATDTSLLGGRGTWSLIFSQ
jgi:hypothetical protein